MPDPIKLKELKAALKRADLSPLSPEQERTYLRAVGSWRLGELRASGRKVLPGGEAPNFDSFMNLLSAQEELGISGLRAVANLDPSTPNKSIQQLMGEHQQLPWWDQIMSEMAGEGPFTLLGGGAKAGVRGLTQGIRRLRFAKPLISAEPPTSVPTNAQDLLNSVTGRGLPFLDEAGQPIGIPRRVTPEMAGRGMALPPQVSYPQGFLDRAAGSIGLTLPKTGEDLLSGMRGAMLDPEPINLPIRRTAQNVGRSILHPTSISEGAVGDVMKGVGGAAVETVGLVPRGLMTMGDASAVLRQGLFMTVPHPGRAAQAFKTSMRTLFSEENVQAVDAARRSHPRFAEAVNEARMFHGGLEGGLLDSEEVFVSKFLKRMPLVGPAYRASNRIYTTYLNELRHLVFNDSMTNWERTGALLKRSDLDARAKRFGAAGIDDMKGLWQRGRAPKVGDKVKLGGKDTLWTQDMDELAGMEVARYKTLRHLGSFINHASGRGTLPFAERNRLAQQVLSLVFFAPRLLMSYPQLIGDLAGPSNLVRGKVAKDLVKTVGVGIALSTLAAQSGMAEVELDGRSPDFGKIRVGQHRWNIWGGFQPIARHIGQALAGEAKQPGTDLIYDREWHKTVGEFLRYKLSPGAGLAVDLKTGTNVLGEPVEATGKYITNEVFENITPLFIQDTLDAIALEGVVVGGARSAPGLFGVGTQSYMNKPERFFEEVVKSGWQNNPRVKEALPELDMTKGLADQNAATKREFLVWWGRAQKDLAKSKNPKRFPFWQ